MTQQEATINGRVARVAFKTNDGAFNVFTVSQSHDGTLVRAISRDRPVWEGQEITMTGRWAVDTIHGRQFQAETTETSHPTDADGLRSYLSSGAFTKIGKVTADRLVTTFGAALPKVIESDPSRLEGLPGIGKNAAKNLVRQWKRNAGKAQDDEIFLRGLRMTPYQMRALDKAHGANGAHMVRQDPYMLTSTVRGIGFTRADTLAEGLGVGREDARRIKAGLMEAMRLARLKGHCMLPKRDLVRNASILLKLPLALVADTLDQDAPNQLVKVSREGDDSYATATLDRQEREIAAILSRLAGEPAPWRIKNPGAALAAADRHTGKPLSPSQQDAFMAVIARKASVITGGPGVGKTTLLKAVLHALRHNARRPSLTAPTGRAAVNMMDATGLDADTMHVLLGTRDDGGFLHDRHKPLDCDLLVVDETSMADIPIMHALLDALPREAGLLLIGDVEQLEPVGPGRPFADIIESSKLPVFRLTEVHRQAEGSKIVSNSHRIRRGDMPEVSTDPSQSDFLFFRAGSDEAIAERIVHLASNGLPNLLGIDPLKDVQVLSPMNVRPLGTVHLQPLLKRAINPSLGEAVQTTHASFGVNDKVVHIQNNYDIGVRNGEIGVVTAVDRGQNTLTVDYGKRSVEYDGETLDELRLGYAISVHKSQGSEYPAVVMPMTLGHQFMLRRRLIITAFSRARRMLVLVGHIDALARAVSDVRSEERHTQLKRLLETA